MTAKKSNLKESLAKLSEVTNWFEKQREIDVEAGLEKVREGVALIKECKERLAEIQNEFEMIQREAEGDSKPKRASKSAEKGEFADLGF